jgi:hypothetical protein
LLSAQNALQHTDYLECNGQRYDHVYLVEKDHSRLTSNFHPLGFGTTFGYLWWYGK